jgi:hypothetical protein
MTKEEFLKEHPRPWSFEQTHNGGVVYDANDLPLIILSADDDWDEESGSPHPLAFNDVAKWSPLIELIIGDE